MSEAKKRGLGRGLSALLPGGPPLVGPLGDAHPPASMPTMPAPAAAVAPRPRTYFAAGIEELYPSP